MESFDRFEFPSDAVRHPATLRHNLNFCLPIALIQLHNRVGAARADKAEYGTGALLTVDDVLGPGGVVEAFRALRDRGFVRFFGCSAYGGDPAAVARLIDSGAFDTIIVNYSMLNRTAWEPDASVPRNYGGVGKRAATSGMGAIGLRVLDGGTLANNAERAVRFALANRDLAPSHVGVGREMFGAFRRQVGRADQGASIFAL